MVFRHLEYVKYLTYSTYLVGTERSPSTGGHGPTAHVNSAGPCEPSQDGHMGAHDDRARAQDRARGRQAEGSVLAASLVGLDVEAALGQVEERGFDPQVVPHDVEAVTADLRHNRIRLFLDDKDTVVRAHAG